MLSVAQAWKDARLAVLERVITGTTPSLNRAAHFETGERGELAAFFYLRRQAYNIVARGWRSHIAKGDLDLIAWDGDSLCFVEVKTRGSRVLGAAE